jgi:hypothetical protein
VSAAPHASATAESAQKLVGEEGADRICSFHSTTLAARTSPEI